MKELIEYLLKLDTALLLLLNRAHSGFTDWGVRIVNSHFTWIPLLIILLSVTVRYFRKDAIIHVSVIATAGLLSYCTAEWIMKPLFARLRPCADPDINGLIHLVEPCSNSYSFVSSQAAIAFALATCFHRLLKRKTRWSGLIFLWAVIVSCCRVLAGQHYPGDIIIGAMVGIVAALIVLRILINVRSPKVS